MDVNKVTFGNFSIGAKGAKAKKQEQKEEAPKAIVSGEGQNTEGKDFLDALNIAGLQNKAQISRVDRKEVNPAEFLSAERIADIEAMMGKFEDGVASVANVIEQELPGFFAADVKNALAAKIYAEE